MLGINWAGGLAGAASGLEGMVALKEKEVGYLYDQVSQQNQFRQQAAMQKSQQDFLSGEREAGQAWKLENEIPLEKRKIELQGELAKSQQESLDVQRSIENQLRQQANNISQYRAESSAAGDVEDSLEALRRNDTKELEGYQKAVDELGWGAAPSTAVKTKAAYDSTKTKFSIYGETPQDIRSRRRDYEKAYQLITGGIVYPEVMNIGSGATKEQKAQISQATQTITSRLQTAREQAKAYADLPEPVRQAINRKVEGSGSRLKTFGEEMEKVRANPSAYLEGGDATPEVAGSTGGAERTDVGGLGPKQPPQDRMKLPEKPAEGRGKEVLATRDPKERAAKEQAMYKDKKAWAKSIEARARTICTRSGLDFDKIKQAAEQGIYNSNSDARKTYNDLMAAAEKELLERVDERKQDFIQPDNQDTLFAGNTGGVAASVN